MLLLLLLSKSFQSFPTLWDPVDGSPPGSSVPGILQARTLERVAIAFSNAWKWKVKEKSLSRVRLLVTPWTVHEVNCTLGLVCHSLLQWITFGLNSLLWPTHLGWPCTTWLTASLSYSSPLTMRRQWSKKRYPSQLPCPTPGGLPNPGIEPRSPSFQTDYLSSESPRETKSTGILSLLQGNFLTQESNWALLHCRQILYRLRNQGSSLVCQQIWKTQQWPQDWKRSILIPIFKKGSTKERANYQTTALNSHASKAMLKI